MKTGYGGAGTMARRLGGTVRTAGALYGALTPAAPGQAPGAGQIDRTLLAGRSADEVMNAVIEAVRPVDGTQDTEASRASIKDALADLLARFPEADLLNLSEDQREFAVERYVSMDVFRRFELDLGKAIQDKAPDARTAVSRLKEVRDFVRETVAAAFRRLSQAGQRLTTSRAGQLVQTALREACQVFESYAQ